jgi:sec-independent protein translocase protein TatA
MGDMAQGIKAFKKGMAEDDTASAKPETMKTIDGKPSELKDRAATEKKFEGGTV